MSQLTPPLARTQMLIRRPIAEVFEAFVDPEVTSQFWFSRGSGRLQPGARVTWFWDMYGVSADVEVQELETPRRLRIAWPTPVEWVFTPHGASSTLVVITASGFTGDVDTQVSSAIDSMGGFSFLLAGCKAWLEHGIRLQLVEDHHPGAGQ